MTIKVDSNLTTTSAYIELFKLDFSILSGLYGGVGLPILYLTPSGVNADNTPISFDGNQYIPYPVQVTGLASVSDGAPPRPILDIANVDKLIGMYTFIYGDVVGASVTYIRTYASYLGISSSISAPPLKFTIARKISHTQASISFELRTPLDKERSFLPARQMLKKDFPGLGLNKTIR